MFLSLILYVVFVTCLNIKQSLGYAWFLRPHSLDKLIFLIVYWSIKLNIGHAWLLGPRTLGKLILLLIIRLSFK